jgi:hypothetical protein
MTPLKKACSEARPFDKLRTGLGPMGGRCISVLGQKTLPQVWAQVIPLDFIGIGLSLTTCGRVSHITRPRSEIHLWAVTALAPGDGCGSFVQ